jgi:hypothetical protein
MAAFAYVNQMRELRQKELERGSPTISPEMARSMQSGADLAITEQAKLKEIITKNVEEIRDLWQDATLYMADATSQAFGDMLTGLRSFKDGALSIWRSLQQTVSGIIAQLVNNYLRGLLAMGQGTAAAFGGGGGGAAAGGGALGSVAGAGLGVAQQALGGGGGTAAGMPGAWGAFGQAAVVGGVAGFSTGYGSRSYTAGALTGAGTGALAGLQFGLQTGNWYVAAGAAGVGAVMGLLGAKLGKNADAKQVEMARLDYYRSQGGLYGAYKVQEAAGVFAGDPKGVEAYHGFNAAKTSEDFTYWGEKLEEAILQRRTGSPTGYPNPSVPMNPPQPKGTVNGVPFYANEVFGVKTPHLAVIGDAREAENVVKDSTLKRLAGGAEVVTAIEQLSAKIDRVFSDLPRANAVALSSALVLAGVKGR